MQARPQQRERVDGAGEPGPGRSGDVESPAAGEGQAVSRAGAHCVRGKAQIAKASKHFLLHQLLAVTYSDPWPPAY